MRSTRVLLLVLLMACLLGRAARLAALETTYGQDPVPTTGFFKDYINLGYGADPIPRKTLLQRWSEWRAVRGRPKAPLFQGAPSLLHQEAESAVEAERRSSR